MTKFESDTTKDAGQVPPAVHGVLFIVCFAMFIFGFWLMGEGYAQEEAWMFTVGFMASALAFFLPIHLRQD